MGNLPTKLRVYRPMTADSLLWRWKKKDLQEIAKPKRGYRKDYGLGKGKNSIVAKIKKRHTIIMVL